MLSFLPFWSPEKPSPFDKAAAGMPIKAGSLEALQADDQFLISYPRSGNTWTRHLLKDLILFTQPDIEEKSILEHNLPSIHAYSVSSQPVTRPRIFKSHNIRDINIRNHRTVYLFRKPADTLLSYFYYGIYAQIKWRVPIATPDEFCYHFLSTWQQHVKLALKARSKFPEKVMFVAYENLVQNSLGELRRISNFFGINASDSILSEALQRNTFDKLQAAEKQQRKDEQDLKVKGLFFRKGHIGSSKEELKEQTVRFVTKSTDALYRKAMAVSMKGSPR